MVDPGVERNSLPNAYRLISMESPAVVTSEDTFRQLVSEANSPAPRIPIEVTLGVREPFAAYCRARDQSDGFFFETSGGRDGWGYFGIDPVERVTVWPEKTSLQQRDGSSLTVLSDYLDAEELVRGNCDIPYPCGLFGWFSYDIARELEPQLEITSSTEQAPRLQFGLYDTVVSWETKDEPEHLLRITACPKVTGSVSATYQTGLEKARKVSETIGPHAEETDSLCGTDMDLSFSPTCSQGEYERRVSRVKEYIHDGDTFQANISQQLTGTSACQPYQIFSALRAGNPAPYSALLEFREIELMCASPELLLECSDGTVTTEPIAGTRPRGATAVGDEANEAELRQDEKERAEHAMLVDLERNDIGKIASVGSVTVDEYRRVDRYSSVMHLVSRISGDLRDDKSVLDAVAGLFPGGTITGAPKPRTMEIIDEVEQTPRGPYTGSIGAFGFDDRATLNIIIRTIVRENDTYSLRVGGGIVHDSEPAQEYQETLDKAQGLIDAIESAPSFVSNVR